MAETIDAALDMLHYTGLEYGDDLSNHGPMAAEAMLAILGRLLSDAQCVAELLLGQQNRDGTIPSSTAVLLPVTTNSVDLPGI